jgi:hypothetical protein
LQGASVAFHARLEGAFAKQGTSIAVCLLVIDKRAGPKSTAVINRATVADLVPSSRRFHRAVGSQLNWHSWPHFQFRLPNHAHLTGRIPLSRTETGRSQLHQRCH